MRGARRRRVSLAAVARVVASRDAPAVPFADLSPLERSAVEEALIVAWSRVPAAAARVGVDLSSADEESITRLLRGVLDGLRRDRSNPVPGFSDREFDHIPESEAIEGVDGSVLYPDLVVRPRNIPATVPLGRTVDYGLVIECKLLDARRAHHSLRTYCVKGLLRFLTGGYAAAMPSGMLLAYVRCDWSVPGELVRHFSEANYAREYQVTEMPALAGHRTPARVPVYSSLHRRDGVLVWGRHPAGDIAVTHLWLRC